jgi:hypothetical protein
VLPRPEIHEVAFVRGEGTSWCVATATDRDMLVGERASCMATIEMYEAMLHVMSAHH